MWQVMPFGSSDYFEAKPLAKGWTSIDTKPSFDDSEDNKKLFGVELAKNSNLFEAANSIFPQVNIALWVSRNWILDPIVIASKDLYLKTLNSDTPLLDKNQLAAKVLELAEEIIQLSDGSERYVCDAKDRVAALRLYSEIAGYTGKVNIDASTSNFTHNEMLVKLVNVGQKENLKTIHTTIDNDDDKTVEPLPLKLKLVK